MHHISYLQAIVMGLVQGFTELFPVSSLGHGVILPGLLGWHGLVSSQASSESFFLAFLVGLHVGTAFGLLAHYWRDWLRIIQGFFSSLVHRRMTSPDARLAWMLGLATIPVGITGLLLEHMLRTLFAKPLAASIFLTVNGFLLLGGELVRRRTLERHGHLRGAVHRGAVPDSEGGGFRRLESLSMSRAIVIGTTQILALFAGISRSGVTMVAGISEGLDHEDAARFSFLLATPVILLAGVLKLPDLTGHLGDGVRGQTVAAAACAAVTAFISVKFLVRWFRTRTLWPFGVYCLLAGVACIIYFG